MKRQHKKFDPMAALNGNETLRRLNPQFLEGRIARSLQINAPYHDNRTKASDVVYPTPDPQNSVKSPSTLVFTIPGQPMGKPRQTRSDKWKKRPCVMRYRAWADKARASVPKGESLGIYREISFVAYLEFPKSYSVTKRAWLTGQPHFEKPDGDNILKALLDSLFPEDKYIWKFSGEKRWADGQGARIEVELR